MLVITGPWKRRRSTGVDVEPFYRDDEEELSTIMSILLELLPEYVKPIRDKWICVKRRFDSEREARREDMNDYMERHGAIFNPEG